MKNDYGIEIQAEPMYVQLPMEEYELLKKKLAASQEIMMKRSFENGDLERQAMADTKTIVRLQREVETLKTINGNLQKEIMDLRIKLGGKR